MDLNDLLEPSVVAFDSTATSPKAVLERAAELLAPICGVSAEEIVEALDARERDGTTGFGNGTAIPHGRLPGVDTLHGAVLRLAHPIEWNAVDGLPVDIFFVLVGPEAGSAQHLKTLARVSRVLRDTAFVEKLRGAGDAGALWALLSADWRKAA
ncbi:PTS sugar transporter subunit IIA [Sandaracinobacteroides hominis]|uniref:PTS sugar transporter subunit IIA n=1 Tax=Sandaracinobacteroides hominis TaxID=2780086 RepID=UPI0018F33C5E|nr:PTS sugar transporter subunit IIA [Sandaracinobacteroides hominis]